MPGWGLPGAGGDAAAAAAVLRARARWAEPESAGKMGGQDVWTWGNLAGGDAGSLLWTRAVPRAGVWLHGW